MRLKINGKIVKEGKIAMMQRSKDKKENPRLLKLKKVEFYINFTLSIKI